VSAANVVAGHLRGKDHAERACACRILAALGPDVLQCHIDGISACLEDAHPIVRHAACRAVATLEAQSLNEISGKLLRCLVDEEDYVRGIAAETLRKLGPSRTRYPLDLCCSSMDPMFQMRKASTRCSRPIRQVFHAWFEQCDTSWHPLVKQRDPQASLKLCTSRNAKKRVFAALVKQCKRARAQRIALIQWVFRQFSELTTKRSSVVRPVVRSVLRHAYSITAWPKMAPRRPKMKKHQKSLHVPMLVRMRRTDRRKHCLEVQAAADCIAASRAGALSCQSGGTIVVTTNTGREVDVLADVFDAAVEGVAVDVDDFHVASGIPRKGIGADERASKRLRALEAVSWRMRWGKSSRLRPSKKGDASRHELARRQAKSRCAHRIAAAKALDGEAAAKAPDGDADLRGDDLCDDLPDYPFFCPICDGPCLVWDPFAYYEQPEEWEDWEDAGVSHIDSLWSTGLDWEPEELDGHFGWSWRRPRGERRRRPIPGGAELELGGEARASPEGDAGHRPRRRRPRRGEWR